MYAIQHLGLALVPSSGQSTEQSDCKLVSSMMIIRISDHERVGAGLVN